MSLKSHAFSLQSGKTKELFFRPASAEPEYECVPYFYIEARIDYADVRTGHQVTCGLNDLLELDCIDNEFLWTRDMVRPVDPALLQTSKPEGAKTHPLPPHIDSAAFARLETQYIRYLLRHAETRVLRNFALNIYSLTGETPEEFRTRCMDLQNEPFRNELDTLREIANRRLERIEERFLKSDRQGGFESDRMMAQARSRFHEVSENIAQLFLKTELTLEEVSDIEWQVPSAYRPDLDQALDALVIDVSRDVQRLLTSYQDRVKNMDEYIVHPNLKDLHLVRSCIVWMPAKVLRA